MAKGKRKTSIKKSRVMPGFEKFITYGFKGRKVSQPINSKK